jgi:hypothetical protein
MGDAFRSPSAAPFVVVTEAATVRERGTNSCPVKHRYLGEMGETGESGC